MRDRRTSCPSSPCSASRCSVSCPASASPWGVSILNVFRRAWWPHQAVLGRPTPSAASTTPRSSPDVEHLPGLAIYRFKAPLLFVNARTSATGTTAGRGRPRPAWIMVAAEPITDVDTTAADMLDDLDERVNGAATRMVFAELKDAVRDKIERYPLEAHPQPDHFFPTLDGPSSPYARPDR